MNKTVYIFLFITALLNKQIIIKAENNNFFRPGIDNPYELAEKPLNDQELAEQSGTPEKVNSLIKLIKKYKINYRDYMATQEPITNILKLISHESNQTMEEALIILTSYYKLLLTTTKNQVITIYNIKKEASKIKKEIKTFKIQYKEKFKYLSDEGKNSIEAAIIINFCNKKIQACVPMRAQYANPGIKNAYKMIFDNQLIQDGDITTEAALLIYFFTKEYLGELQARLKAIQK